jgi:hypothetical protein
MNDKIFEGWEDLGDGLKFRSDFNPAPIRKRLGLDGGSPETHISLGERSRLASLLWRQNSPKYLTLRELQKLGGWRIPNPESGSSIFTDDSVIGRKTDS